MHAKLEVRSFNCLELLAFNAQKFRGSRDSGDSPFRKKFKGSCPDCPLRTQTRIERKQCLRHLLRSIMKAYGKDRKIREGG